MFSVVDKFILCQYLECSGRDSAVVQEVSEGYLYSIFSLLWNNIKLIFFYLLKANRILSHLRIRQDPCLNVLTEIKGYSCIYQKSTILCDHCRSTWRHKQSIIQWND